MTQGVNAVFESFIFGIVLHMCENQVPDALAVRMIYAVELVRESPIWHWKLVVLWIELSMHLQFAMLSLPIRTTSLHPMHPSGDIRHSIYPVAIHLVELHVLLVRRNIGQIIQLSVDNGFLVVLFELE